MANKILPFFLFLSRVLAENPFPENPIIWNENEWLLPPISMPQKWNTKWNGLSLSFFSLRDEGGLRLRFFFLSLFLSWLAWQLAHVSQNNFVQAQKMNRKLVQVAQAILTTCLSTSWHTQEEEIRVVSSHILTFFHDWLGAVSLWHLGCGVRSKCENKTAFEVK